jgi:hypothetical protein
MTLKACGNPLCANQSYAVYCSTYCLEVVEPAEEPADDDEYYADQDSDTLLGHIATADAQHQADQAAGGFAAMVCGVQPQPVAPAVQAFPEAPVSMNVHVQVQGRDVLMTLRGTDEAEVLARLEALLSRFPVQAPTIPVRPTTEEPDEDSFCHIHAVPMGWNPAKNGESGWWSHKGPDGWCKGRAKGQRAA